MLSKIVSFVLSAALLTGFTACKPKQTAAQIQAQRVNEFRARQKIKAIEAYTALVTKFPDSEFTPKAKERLTVLGPLPAATPVKKK